MPTKTKTETAGDQAEAQGKADYAAATESAGREDDAQGLRTDGSLVLEAMDSMSDKDKHFFMEIIREYLRRGCTDIRGIAWMHAKRAIGLKVLPDTDDREQVENINTLVEISLTTDWLGGFLKKIFHLWRHDPKHLATPDGMLFMVEQELTNFRMELDAARRVLKANPEYLATDIRQAAAAIERKN